MTLPEQGIPQLAWPANELEEVLAASVGHPGAGGRILGSDRLSRIMADPVLAAYEKHRDICQAL